MTDQSSALFQSDKAGGQVRLRTLMTLRWFAIAGQIAAIAVTERVFGFGLDLGLCSVAVGLSIIVNIVFYFVYPENKRMELREATWMLMFDTVQLAFLLGVTGGITNPFAILIMAPVTVAATALSLRSTMWISAAAIVLLSVIVVWHIPIIGIGGMPLYIPDSLAAGYWLAIVVSIIFVGIYTRQVSGEIQSMSQALLAAQMALAREQKLTDLGGVVAAAAHELGTPLATITLVSSEMASELEKGTDMHDDAMLIRQQADRCRDILRNMGRMGKDDLHVRQALLSAVVEEAAEPHRERGKEIVIETGKGAALPTEQPCVMRRPELIHGLRNLIQNAVDFTATTVWVEIHWTDDLITVRIIDDGPGYPPHLLGRIGDPFIRTGGRRLKRDQKRAEYEGMGLGLFIAKTLLERTGAELNFVNGTTPYTGMARPGERAGAIVEVVWPREECQLETVERTALGENVQFES
ncbi:MAG: two-component sensor histidine kinase [Rhodobacterales bacterium]|nr:MAG: two-component sensor histidine kinase [Rhodobacterales bacterium]